MSLSLIDAAIKGTSLALDVCDIGFSLTKWKSASLAEKVALISKTTSTALGALNLGAEAGESSLPVQKALNLTHIVTSFVDLFAQIPADTEQLVHGHRNVTLFFERTLGNLCTTVRAAIHAGALQEKTYLAMSEEERSHARRPIYEGSGEDERLVGYKPVDKAECEKLLQQATDCERVFGIAECLSKARVVSRTTPLVEEAIAKGTAMTQEALQKLTAFIKDCKEAWKVLTHQERVDLLKRETIPAPFYEDDVFSQYICPLTGLPIRHPVKEPDSTILYEKDAISRFIDLHHTSPSTGKALTKEELLPARDEQELIDNRLKRYQDNINLHDREIEALAREII